MIQGYTLAPILAFSVLGSFAYVSNDGWLPGDYCSLNPTATQNTAGA